MIEAEFTCKGCGHQFNRTGQDEPTTCPRCGGQELERSSYLFGSDGGELSPEDYFDVVLAPCCQPNWLGWRAHHHGCQPLPDKEKEI